MHNPRVPLLINRTSFKDLAILGSNKFISPYLRLSIAWQSPLKLAELIAQPIPPLVVCGILPFIPKVRRCVELVSIRVSREECSG